ncbi:MAG: hypothetical protein ACREUQ_09565, partial [Burkholderiales bacterium]
FQLVAQWILGVNQMRAASAGGFGGGGGGILGALLGGLLGIGGGGGGGGGGGLFGGLFGRSSAGTTTAGGLSLSGLPIGPSTPGQAQGLASLFSLVPGLGGGVNLGGGLSAGGGVTSALALPAGASFGARLRAGLGGLLPAGFFAGAGALGFGSPLRGLLSGVAVTAGLASAFGVELSAIFGTIGGLATLGIGAVIGLLFGFLGGGKKKRERERLERQLIGDIQKIEDAYKAHQIDFDSTIAQLEQMRAQYVQAQKKVGGGPHRRVHSHIDQAEKEIRAIEDERKRRVAEFGGGQEVGPAQFHRGGLVTNDHALMSPGRPGARAFHSGEVVNANLLTGESVLNRGATSRLGKAGVDALNAGGAGLVIHMHFPDVYDSRGFEQVLQKNQSGFIRFLRRLEAEGAM